MLECERKVTMSESSTLRLATRGSDLALTQSRTVADSLRAFGMQVELEIITTAGDRSAAARFADIGPQGVFVREIEQALIERRADVAVHSYKDLPTASPAELCIGAVPARKDPHDVMLIRNAQLDTNDRFVPLTRGARVGTSSARRQAWLRHFRHDVELLPLRGNVPTRIARLRDGDYDAIVLAAAGLERLRAVEELLEPLLSDITVSPLDADSFVPAPAQGALAVQCRAADESLRELLAEIDDRLSRTCIEVERDALKGADGGCEIAFGAHCRKTGSEFELTCMLERNSQVHTVTKSSTNSSDLGTATWHALEREFAGE
jgi:hydroxymethylbilane synthase